MALRAFIDESGTHGPPVFVLGGWISTVEKWEQFTKAWNNCQLMYPRIHVLKMREAMNLRGQFHGWSKEERDKRLRMFCDIIYEHIDIGLFFRIPYSELAKLRSELPPRRKRFGSEYFWGVYGLMSQFMKRQEQLGISEPVSFVFDENVIEKGAILEAWDRFSKEWRALAFKVGSVASFENDEIMLPLQAAELIAWQPSVLIGKFV